MNPGMMNIIMIVVMFAIFYFLLIRPQQKRQKAVAQMQSELTKGDAIVTIGGMHGTIETVTDTTIVIKSGGSHLTFDRSAIREVVKG
ncbi:preprotein translocase subunit YajC [Bacillus pseudomycoides]|jgi:preprotein translocase subunit YajC|nr:preprotein translocase subunit YajC [Bacillus pseudomycoides]